MKSAQELSALDSDLVSAVLEAKRRGQSDAQIAKQMKLSLRQLEQIAIHAYGLNISNPDRARRIRAWAPQQFQLEGTTVWSFKHRGNWATHHGQYRGNWSPYIPRNLILRYTKPGDLVLDPFVGSGTTAIEAKLLGRRCIARDINPACVELTLKSLQFLPPLGLFNSACYFEPEVSVGDARDLQGIESDTVDLVCAHPPYAGIISYSAGIAGDLSQLSAEAFVAEMRSVASECYRVLKPGGKCAVLIGDARKEKHIVPIGFRVIEAFLSAGFLLRELVIKIQHNCKTTGFWYRRSIEHNFLLLAHEYLPIFEKPERNNQCLLNGDAVKLPCPIVEELGPLEELAEPLKTSSVWVFPNNAMKRHVAANVLRRYSSRLISHSEGSQGVAPAEYKAALWQRAGEVLGSPACDARFLVVEAQDFRSNGSVVPAAKLVLDALESHPRLWLKEIVVLAPQDLADATAADANLAIVHKYLIVYEVIG